MDSEKTGVGVERKARSDSSGNSKCFVFQDNGFIIFKEFIRVFCGGEAANKYSFIDIESRESCHWITNRNGACKNGFN